MTFIFIVLFCFALDTCLLPQLLPLHLVHKIKVRFVKMQHPNIAILSTRSVRRTAWVDMDVIQRAKVAPYTANLILKDLVVETGLKLALARRRCSDIHGRLATTQNHVVLLGGDGSRVERRVGHKCL